jgi:hypothetical protein
MKELFSGEMENCVQAGRIVQAMLFLLIFLGGLLGYKRWRKHIDMYRYSLIALYVFIMIYLYVFIMIYYFFSPLTYRYYLFSFLVISSVLCGMIILNKSARKEITEGRDHG